MVPRLSCTSVLVAATSESVGGAVGSGTTSVDVAAGGCCAEASGRVAEAPGEDGDAHPAATSAQAIRSAGSGPGREDANMEVIPFSMGGVGVWERGRLGVWGCRDSGSRTTHHGFSLLPTGERVEKGLQRCAAVAVGKGRRVSHRYQK
jgi:hypothetical protein